MRRPLIAGLLAVTAGCAGEPVDPGPVDPNYRPATGPQWQIALRRGGCGYRCPVYEVSIAPDGTVDYRGIEHVQRTGRLRTQADAFMLYRLQELIERSGYFELPESFTRDSVDCGPWTSDQQVVTLSVTDGIRTHFVVHDWGCSRAPEMLKDLEQLVDRTAGSERFVRGDSPR